MPQITKLTGEAWLASAHKRSFDKMLCVATAAPVGVAVLASAALIRMVDRMDPFFVQERYGDPMEETVWIPKLRTMPIDTPETRSEGRRDPRATGLGVFLRRTHIDELPQWTNVWSGEMSAVGPRPLSRAAMTDTLNVLSDAEAAAFLRARQVAKPGIVDPHSAVAYRHVDKVDLRDVALGQIEYAQSASLRTDLSLLRSAGMIAIEGLYGAGPMISSESAVPSD